ncbi:hypothetical protein [Pedobacter aquatilis]|uniref:hypothetical protein n=1 Tax=Pedobacter aquatilis TaxID=351343 RepID=UPI00292F55D8|nr:hypothetical protein [Pedobacter aquatilis]
MYKTQRTYIVGKNDYLDKVFRDKILPSGFIDKGRCGIGGTTMEILYTGRCSIITVPNISILKCKKQQHSEIEIVYGDVTREEVYNYLSVKRKGLKIMTTPEGIEKIMWAANQLGRTNELMEEWFFMLDEAHTFITEDYRENILAPFKYFFEWKNKCIITATPYLFTHPKMVELDYHQVVVSEKLGNVTLVNSYSVAATLDYTLQHANSFPGNLHIFLNSVTEIAKAIDRAQLSDCNIYCANDKDKSNLKKLGELAKFYYEDTNTESFKKINFYTSKYFEGWDMYDDNATLIVVTDIHCDHTKIGISDKAVQAFGRLRGKRDTQDCPSPHQLIHITNAANNLSIKRQEHFAEEFTYSANRLIQQHNINCKDVKFAKTLLSKEMSKYADVDNRTQMAALDYMKLDQQINEAAKRECYNHINFIEEAWESKYSVDKQQSTIKYEGKTTMKRKSASTKFKEDYHQLLDGRKSCKKNMYLNFLNESIEQDIKKNNPLAYEAAKLLPVERVEELNYSISKIKQELILKGNAKAEIKLLKLLDHYFKVGAVYTNEFITETLQSLYNQLQIRTKSGEIRVAKPAQLGELGRFEIDNCKPKNKNNEFVHGYIILRKQFQLHIAA